MFTVIKNSINLMVSARRNRKNNILLVVAFIAIMFICDTVPAQPYMTYMGNGEYLFRLTKAQDDVNLAGDNNSPVINVTMECLAANGYGQWTMTSNAGTYNDVNPNWKFSPDQFIDGRDWDANFGWFLLGNMVAKPNESFDEADIIPLPAQSPGIVSGGAFNSTSNPAEAISTCPTGVQVTANLTGSVRYVWVSSDRKSFHVQGLNDERGASVYNKQIKINLSDFNFPNGLSPVDDPALHRQVIDQKIFSYSNASTATQAPLTFHDVVSNETDSRDEFSISCDQNYLYIVWSTTTNTGGQQEVWATALSMSNNTVATGYPKMIGVGASGVKRPTVYCDVRTAPGSPAFKVAYIDIATSGVVASREVGGVTTSVALPKKYHHPFNVITPLPTYTAATHSRILVSSVAGNANLSDCIYVLTGDGLMMYKNIDWVTAANNEARYVDGVLNIGASKSYPNPITGTSNITDIVDNHIIAFTNPYDAQNASALSYDQYHCLYQPVYSDIPSGQNSPLIIVRGKENGFAIGSGTDTRMILTKTLTSTFPITYVLKPSPEHYVGAVNQMGIHVHWYDETNTHHYARDIGRMFDEPIEESTLVTNDCYIGDGTSHGGTNGAQISDERVMTMWTDPNYGAAETLPVTTGTRENDGLYAINQFPNWTNGQNDAYLNFNEAGLYSPSSSTQLKVGDASGDYAVFCSMPNSKFGIHSPSTLFNQIGSVFAPTSGFTLTVNPNSTWECYQNLYVSESNPVRLILEGQDNTGIEYANLHVRGGAVLSVNRISAEIGSINMNYHPNILPLHVSTTTDNSSETGKIIYQVNEEISIISNSQILADLPDGVESNIFQIAGTPPTTGNTLTLSNTSLTNSNAGGFARIQYNSGSIFQTAGDVLVDDCTLLAFSLHFYNQVLADITIQNSVFDYFNNKAIYICNTNTSLSAYGSIIVHNNLFPGEGTFWSDASGIYIQNYSVSGYYGQVNITENNFNSSSTIPGELEAAICFENTTGNIERNTIIGDAYAVGIKCFSSSFGGSTPITRSYLCNNYLQGILGNDYDALPGIGIQTSSREGYTKLCQVKGCKLGYRSVENDHAMIVFTSITDCAKMGIYSGDATSVVDLSGVHSIAEGDDDYAAYDTIANNGLSMGVNGAQVAFTANAHVDYGNRLQGSWAWTEWGENNTIASTNSPKLLWSVSGSGVGEANNVDRNFWGTSIDPFNGNGGPGADEWDLGSNDVHSEGVNYVATSGGARSSYTAVPFYVSCSGNWDIVGKREKNHVSDAAPLEVDSCQRWHSWLGIFPQTPEENWMRYDSLRRYIESCAPIDDDCHDAFVGLGSSVSYLKYIDTTLVTRYREWLLKVVHIKSPDPAYICACLTAIAGHSGNINATIAIYKYLMEYPGCKSDSGNYHEMYNRLIKTRHEQWQWGDTTIPEDTVLPSLADLGLGFLLGVDDDGNGTVSAPEYITSLGITPNPFRSETTVRYHLSQTAYVLPLVYDQLGRVVFGDGNGRVFTEGDHEFTLDGTNLSSGVYYIRLQASSQKRQHVRTIKIVKE